MCIRDSFHPGLDFFNAGNAEFTQLSLEFLYLLVDLGQIGIQLDFLLFQFRGLGKLFIALLGHGSLVGNQTQVFFRSTAAVLDHVIAQSRPIPDFLVQDLAVGNHFLEVLILAIDAENTAETGEPGTCSCGKNQ